MIITNKIDMLNNKNNLIYIDLTMSHIFVTESLKCS